MRDAKFYIHIKGRQNYISLYLFFIFLGTKQEDKKISGINCSMKFRHSCWSRDAPTGLIFNNHTLCPRCIYVFCIYLRTDSDLCHLEHKLIGFYSRDEKCLQRGTDWGFK